MTLLNRTYDVTSTQSNGLDSSNVTSTDKLKDLCIKVIPFWNNLSREDIVVERVAAAYTNDAYKLNLKDESVAPGNVKEVMVKNISPHKTILFNVDDYILIATNLGDHDLGPKILGSFQGGVIQKWIKGKPMVFESLHNLSTMAALARYLARFHRICTEIAPKHLERRPAILRLLEVWSKKALDIAKKHNLSLDVKGMIKGIKVYKTALEEHMKTSKALTNSVLFCHNDPGYRNIIDTDHGPSLVDFEYSGFNYVGCDISRFFYESSICFKVGVPPHLVFEDPLDIDYTTQSLFVSVYLSEFLGKNVLPSEKPVIDEFLTSLKIHSLGVYLYCAFWRITMLSIDEIQLFPNFIDFAEVQYQLYKNQLEKLVKNGVISKNIIDAY